jgi:hypothetical protein
MLMAVMILKKTVGGMAHMVAGNPFKSKQKRLGRASGSNSPFLFRLAGLTDRSGGDKLEIKRIRTDSAASLPI